MEQTVLVVEDDARIASLIKDYFGREYSVILAANGAQALIEFEQRKIDLVVLDIMLPVLDGWEVCRHIRARSRVPIVMLTARTDEASNLRGFELGVDDYVAKPFSPRVLLAKTKAILNRVENKGSKPEAVYVIDPGFVISEPAHTVTVEGNELSFSPTEFTVLLHLVQNRNLVLTRDMLLDRVWGTNYYGDDRVVDTNIKRIREKLGKRASYIGTVRGSGYKFEVR